MSDGMMIERLTAAVIEQLHRQGKMLGVTVEDNGETVRIDGPWLVKPIVRALLKAMHEPTEAMITAAAEDAGVWSDRQQNDDAEYYATPHAAWTTMIDAALVEEE